MTMPPWSEDAEESRPFFQRLRQLASGLGVLGLSMGMSHDLEVGIEEGATIVRVGRPCSDAAQKCEGWILFPAAARANGRG